MNNIPKKLRAELSEDPYYQTCSRNELLHDHECEGRITKGRQIKFMDDTRETRRIPDKINTPENIAAGKLYRRPHLDDFMDWLEDRYEVEQ